MVLFLCSLYHISCAVGFFLKKRNENITLHICAYLVLCVLRSVNAISLLQVQAVYPLHARSDRRYVFLIIKYRHSNHLRLSKGFIYVISYSYVCILNIYVFSCFNKCRITNALQKQVIKAHFNKCSHFVKSVQEVSFFYI